MTAKLGLLRTVFLLGVALFGVISSWAQAVAAAPVSASASSTVSGKQSAACDGTGSMADLRDCQERRLIEADRRLNKVYQQLLLALDSVEGKGHRQALIQAQKSWLSWRDREARLCSTAEGWPPTPDQYGSGTGLQVGFCLERITQARAEQLSSYLRSLR